MKEKRLIVYITIFILLTFSVLNTYNARYLNYAYSLFYLKQIIWIILGLVLFFFLRKCNKEKILRFSPIIYIINIFLLIIVLFIGKSINGAKAWLTFKYMSLQPSEIMKVSLTLFLLYFSEYYKNKMHEISYLLICFIFTFFPSILVFLEPDTGAIIFYFLIMICLVYNYVKKKRYLIFIGILTIMIGIAFFYLFFYKQDFLISIMGTSLFYRIDRLINFRNNVGYQMENALVTIANSSFFGTGLNGILLYIPEGHTDFAFAFALGNFGIISGIVIILCYLYIDCYFIKKSQKAHKDTNKYLINSFLTIFLFQQFYNLLMNVNLMPIMGIPLPFLSYGGSSLLTYFCFLGLIF
jgi:rod shape determining protein RodA